MDDEPKYLSTFGQPQDSRSVGQTESAFTQSPSEQGRGIVRARYGSDKGQDSLGRILDSQLGIVHCRPPTIEGEVLPALVQEPLSYPGSILHCCRRHVRAPSHSRAQPKPGNSCQRQTRYRPARSRRSPFSPIIARNLASLSAM